MRNASFISALTALLAAGALAGCFDRADRFRDAIPGDDALSVKVPDGSGGTGSGSAGVTSEALAEGDTAFLYQVTYGISRVLNGGVFLTLGIIREIASYPPTTVDDTAATWGPFTPSLSPVTWLLAVNATGDDTYDWVLSGRRRTSTSDDDFVPVVAGTTEVQGLHLIRGSFGIDRDAYAALSPVEPGQGAAAATYDTISDPRVVEVALDGWAEGGDAPVSAVYRYTEGADLSGTFAFAAVADTDDAGAAPENLAVTSRWTAGGSGRGDAVATGGDMGAAVVYMSECWDDGFGRTFYDDDLDQSPVVGAVEACPFAEPLYNE
jgi:hypothetical protein